MYRSRLIIFSLMAVAIGIAPVASAAQGEVSGIFDIIPADSPVFFAAPELDGLRGNMQSFIGGLGMPQLPSDPIGIALAQMGIFSGVDNSKGMAFVILSEAATGVKISRLTPLDDSGADEISDEEAPIVIIFGGSSVEEVFAAHSPMAEGENFVFLISGDKAYARSVNGYIYMAPNQRALDAAINATESVADKNDKSRLVAMSAMDMVFSLDAPAAMPVVNAVVKTIEAEMAKGLSRAPATQLDQVAQGVKMVNSMAAAFLKVFAQIETVDFGLSFSESGLKIDKYVKPIAGTDMANVLKVIKPSRADLLAGLPSGKQIMAFGFDAGDVLDTPAGQKAVKDLAAWSLDMYASGIDKNRIDEYMSDTLKAYGSSFNMSAALMAGSDDQPMLVVQRIKVDDPAGAIDLMEKYEDISREIVTSTMKMYGEGSDFNFTRNAFQIDGLNVHENATTYPADFDKPTFGFEKQYLAKLSNGDIAIVNAVPENIKLAIAGMGNSLLSEPAVIAAMKAMPKESFAVAVVSAPGMFDFMLNVLRQSVAEMPPQLFDMLKTVAPTCTDLIACGTAVEGKVLHGRMVMPMGLFQDIIRGVMFAQQQMMQGNQSDNLPPDSF